MLLTLERFKVVADFIEANFNKDTRIADVASGTNAPLSKELKKRGFFVVPIDPELDRRSFRDGIDKRFTLDLAYKFDLLVSIYPCQFTKELIKIAIEADKPLILFPCPCMPTGKHTDYRYSRVCATIKRLLDRFTFQVFKVNNKRYILFYRRSNA